MKQTQCLACGRFCRRTGCRRCGAPSYMVSGRVKHYNPRDVRIVINGQEYRGDAMLPPGPVESVTVPALIVKDVTISGTVTA